MSLRPNFEVGKILLVDDDKVSIMAFKRVMKKMNLMNPLEVAQDGIEALEILRGEARDAPLAPPYLIVLDINMPRMDGHEFLAEMRKDPKLQRSVVFIMTTSGAPEDVRRAYDRNVAGYIIKDDLHASFSRTVAMVDSFSKLIVFPT